MLLPLPACRASRLRQVAPFEIWNSCLSMPRIVELGGDCVGLKIQ